MGDDEGASEEGDEWVGGAGGGGLVKSGEGGRRVIGDEMCRGQGEPGGGEMRKELGGGCGIADGAGGDGGIGLRSVVAEVKVGTSEELMVGGDGAAGARERRGLLGCRVWGGRHCEGGEGGSLEVAGSVG